MQNTVNLKREVGSGRPYVLISEAGNYEKLGMSLSEALSSSARVLLLETGRITDENWSEISDSALKLLREKGVRQASFVAIGPACTIVQHLALLDLKFVRTAVLVDPTSRPHPGPFVKALDKLERFLPLGLPLRSRSKGFDSKAYLQRLRCPILIVSTPSAGQFERKEAHVMAEQCPTAWIMILGSGDQTAELSRLITDFQQIPAKCPQKNLSAAQGE